MEILAVFMDKYKIVRLIFADKPNGVVIITVKVYYSNEEIKQ